MATVVVVSAVVVAAVELAVISLEMILCLQIFRFSYLLTRTDQRTYGQTLL